MVELSTTKQDKERDGTEFYLLRSSGGIKMIKSKTTNPVYAT